MLDATKSDEQRRLLEIELDAVGIRLNKQKPDVVFKKKTTGGVCNEFTAHENFPEIGVDRLLSIRQSNLQKPTNGRFGRFLLHVCIMS